MKKTTCGATRLIALALGLGFLPSAWADFAKTNPVTGETESYTWKFVGTADNVWDSNVNWQDSNGDNPANGGIPAKTSGGDVWDPILFDGSDVNINASMSVEGWNLRMGLYNGASVTMNTFVKYQGDTTMWMTVDETSQLTIEGFGKGNIADNKVIRLSVAKASGIDWNVNLESTANANNTFEYYLKDAGSVSYQVVSAANHMIKMADIVLTGVSQVTNKTLVSFTSSSKTFSADATIKRLDSTGADLNADDFLITVNTTGTTTLTTDDEVGTCEIVQASDGVYLYWVDGDPADVVIVEKTYKPSININFTNGSGNGLTTGADVGLVGYEVPGTSWNNFVVANNAKFSTVNAVDSNGVASVISDVSVMISGTRGPYQCSGLTPASNPLHGYIDESGDFPTPTVTISGIPYFRYRVVVYHSTESGNVHFGYDTINGVNYTYTNGVLFVGTDSWGDSGSQNGANAIAEGGNVLLTGELSGSTLTVVGHRVGSSARGCIAAIQVIEVKPEIGENDLEIPVAGDTTYTVSAAKTLSGTVYITGNGTLTLAGSAKISAATIDVGGMVTLNVDADRLDATTYTGAGTVVYDGTKPATGKGWTDAENWSGTVWVTNILTSSDARTDWELALYGNANSTLRFTGVNLSFKGGTDNVFPGTVDIDGDGMNVCEGYDGSIATFTRLTGSGTLSTAGGSSDGNGLTINDASAFTGTIALTKYKVIIGTATGTSASGVLQIESGKSITVADATAPGGFVVNGTLNVNGTLATSANVAVSGSGNVVFIGRGPIVGNAWWKNEAWTGTVTVKSVTDLIGVSGTGTYIDFNECGNAGSVIELDTVSGWLNPGYVCNVPLKITGKLTLTNGYSGKANAFTVGTLLGSGTIAASGSAPYVVFQIKDDWSGFAGAIQLSTSKVVAFGSEIPSTIADSNDDAGTIYIASGAEVEIKSSDIWWAAGVGFVVDGTLKASARNKWGGSTAMVLGDNGVLELVTGSSYVDDTGVNYSTVAGTGTVRYSGTNWRTLPNGTNMFATTLSVELENEAGVVFHGGTANGSAGVVGGLFGTKNLRNDLGGYSKVLTVKQAKDGVWEGAFLGGDDRLDTFIVDPGASTTGTLTLAGTHTHNNKMTVNGAVNLTGTWVGDVTVEGAFGGTGTLTGSLALSPGATIKVNDAEPLKVTGNVTLEGDIVIVVADDMDVSQMTFLRVTGDGTKVDASAVSSFTVRNDSGKAVRTRVVAKGKELRLYNGGFYIHLQ